MPAVCALAASTRPSGTGSTESSRPSAGMAILLALLGLGAMATAPLGPLALGWIDYHVSSAAADQLRGGDVAGLVLVGPVALAAAWRVATGRPAPTRCHSPRLRIAPREAVSGLARGNRRDARRPPPSRPARAMGSARSLRSRRWRRSWPLRPPGPSPRGLSSAPTSRSASRRPAAMTPTSSRPRNREGEPAWRLGAGRRRDRLSAARSLLPAITREFYISRPAIAAGVAHVLDEFAAAHPEGGANASGISGE